MNANPPTAAINRRDFQDLLAISRLNAKVAKSAVKERSAHVLAIGEQQLSAQYDRGDAFWADAMSSLDEATAVARSVVNERCDALGIPAEFRPTIDVLWFRRGENGMASRRAELRTLLQAQVAAMAQTALARIDRLTAEVQVALLTCQLQEDAARVVAREMPSIDELIPLVSLDSPAQAHLTRLDGFS